MAAIDNKKLKQIFLISLILGMTLLLVINLIQYTTGFLGALTLYVLFVKLYNRMVNDWKWKDWISASLIILFATIVILIPFIFVGYILVDRITDIVNNPDPILQQWDILNTKIMEITHIDILSPETIKQIQGPLSHLLPNMLQSTLSATVNLTILYFVLFFMFINGDEMKKWFTKLFPLHEENTYILGEKAKKMIISNTVVIPLLAVVQGISALIGYMIFGVKEAVIMATITAVASVIPIIGTTIIWIPLALVLVIQQKYGSGIGLFLYGTFVITNIDYVVRLILQKKIANIHPLVTAIGVLIGIKIFGFVGLIFGPTIISILMILIELYTKEFTEVSNET
ncbi:MAG: AI-2E family transporter [Chitinophagales bacterium]|nr:AI-2E family transporter [Chitinophagales bacterium]